MPGVAILACGGTAEHYDDMNRHPMKLWGINNCWTAHRQKPLPDRIIAMDDLQRDWEDGHKKYVRDIIGAGCPVYTATAYEKWPTTRAYPLEKVVSELFEGDDVGTAQMVLGNTIAYALALAISERRSPIHLYGCEFVRPDTRSRERAAEKLVKSHQPDWFKYYKKPLFRNVTEPGVEGVLYLMGMASGLQIKVCLPDGCTLLNYDRPRFFYGYQKQPKP